MLAPDRPQLIELPNGPRAPKTFSDAEYDRRLTGLRATMVELQLDAVLFSSMHNIAYYSDFLYCSFGRPYGLVVTHHSQTTLSANIDFGQPWRRTYGDNLVFTDWERDNYWRGVSKLAGATPRIGIEADHLTLQGREKLEHFVPGCTVVDISPACMRQRMVKSAEEIELITGGARTADIGGAAVVAAIAEGVPEHEIALAGTAAMVRYIASEFPDSEIRDTWVWFQSGINTDGAHNPVTTRRVQKGDILSLNCFPMIAGYYTALERTLFFDHIPSDRHLQLWEANVAVHRRGLELIRPGVRCNEIVAELNEMFRADNLLQYRTFGYGHSFGVLSHYYGREAGLELREDIDTVLEPGMVVSIEPMLTVPEGQPGAGGYREHDILVVTEDGAVNITGFPFGPEHNVVPA
jgi:creatinase